MRSGTSGKLDPVVVSVFVLKCADQQSWPSSYNHPGLADRAIPTTLRMQDRDISTDPITLKPQSQWDYRLYSFRAAGIVAPHFPTRRENASVESNPGSRDPQYAEPVQLLR